MASLVLEILESNHPVDGPEVAVIPGISAVNACAALSGAPLAHDFAVISLSDLLTPWELIERRLLAAAGADFVVALLNPKSGAAPGNFPAPATSSCTTCRRRPPPDLSGTPTAPANRWT